MLSIWIVRVDYDELFFTKSAEEALSFTVGFGANNEGNLVADVEPKPEDFSFSCPILGKGQQHARFGWTMGSIQ